MRIQTHCLLLAAAAGLAGACAAAQPPSQPHAQNNLNATMPAIAAAKVVHDLARPEYDPPDAPAWCKETVPAAIQPFLGKKGLGSPWADKPGPLAASVRGIDRYQANQFVVYRAETARFIYGDYTPLKVDYVKGTLPAYEAVVSKYTAGCANDTERAVALLTKAMPALASHPTMPPCGPGVKPDRNLNDEPLLASRLAWCNEQARIFVRLCQVAGLPARIVHLFYSDKQTGHTVAEFHADGRWCLADASWFTVFPGPDGKLLSAAQCHDRAAGQKHLGLAYHRRMQELIKRSDKELYPAHPDQAEPFRKQMRAKTTQQWSDQHDLFGVMNNPLPK